VGYLIKAGLGLVLFFGGIIVFNLKLQEMLDIGTCASGNVPYEIAPGYECPEGAGTDFFIMFASIPVGLIGAAIFAFRGDPPWGSRRRGFSAAGLGVLAWGIFFAGTGAAMFLGQPYGESVNEAGETVGRPDSQLGSTIVGITFLVMGLPALAFGIWAQVKGFGGRRDERPPSLPGAESIGGVFDSLAQKIPTPSAPASRGGGDTIGKLERLEKLRQSGAITDAEFEKEKAKVLAQQ
jgi:hypothetical protein